MLKLPIISNNKVSNDLNALLLKRKSLHYIGNVLNYISRTFECLILLVGVLAFNTAYIKLMLTFAFLFLFFDAFINRLKYYRFRYSDNIIPSPQKILNSFLFSSFFLYVVKNLNSLHNYIVAIVVYLMLLGLIKDIVSKRLEDLEFSINEFSTPVHELGHFVANEEYQMFNSVLIDLTPNGNSLGRLQIEHKIDIISIDNFISVLMAGFIASKYLLANIKPDVDEIIDIVKLELQSFSFQADDKNKIMETLSNKVTVYRIKENTVKLIKSKKKIILSLAGEIYGKDKVLFKDLLDLIEKI